MIIHGKEYQATSNEVQLIVRGIMNLEMKMASEDYAVATRLLKELRFELDAEREKPAGSKQQ
jgi:hypothetical protein